MRVIRAITYATFKEAVKDKVFYNLVIFSLIILASSRILGMVSSGQDTKIVLDVGIGCISLFGLVVAIFVGANLVYKEIERGTILTVIVKPIDRYEYIVGKYLGLLLTILLNLVLMSMGFYIILKTMAISWNLLLVKGILLIFVELMVIMSIAIMFSTFVSPLLSVVLTLCYFVMGNLSEDFLFVIEKVETPALKVFCKFLYYTVPNFSYLNIKNEVVHSVSVSNDFLLSAILYGVVYSAAILFLSILIFRKRNFK